MSHLRSGNVPRALALAAILSVGVLAPLVPTAMAEPETALLCFEGDPNGTDIPFATCRAGRNEPMNYLQGDTVRLRVFDVDTGELESSNPYVRVWCVENCREVDGHDYYARWGRDTLRFPHDFTDPGPNGDGFSAPGERAPRYNSTWKAAVLLPGGATSERTFHVWAIDAYRSADLTIVPGEHHRIRWSGLDPGKAMEFRLERRIATAQYETFAHFSGNAPADGVFRYGWSVPKDEAGRIAACGTRTDDCYRLVLTGGGKTNETIPFRVGPATIQITNLITTPAGNEFIAGSALIRQRTQSVELAFGMNYPAGALNQGPKLLPGDLPPSVSNPQRGLRVFIEEYNVTLPEEAPVFYNETRMFYQPDRFAWIANWTIPMDLPLDRGLLENNSHYRLRLADARDVHGNKIPGRVLGNFSISPATLQPILVDAPETLPRTEEGSFAFRVAYHNGTLLGPVENKTGLRGCFVLDRTPLRPTCPTNDVVWAKHENDTWVLRVRYPRDYEDVETQGGHRVFLLDGFEDAWGNKVDARPDDAFRAFVSNAFTVVAGSPRIEFSTVQRGEDANTLVRGNRVNVQAIIKYADGSPFNHTVLDNETRTLNITLTRRGPNGAVQHEGPLTLQEVDVREGRWAAQLDLSRDDTQTPVGRWTFTFDLHDNLTIPNTNLTRFDRETAAALIHLSPQFQPASAAATGTNVKFRFRLFFENGQPVPTGTIGDRLTGYVHRYDTATKKPTDERVSGLLVPAPVPGVEGEFILGWAIPAKLFAGDYTFVVQGGDAFGNKLGDDAFSRSWKTYSETRIRSALVEPQESVTRGEAATVVFDGREGDMGTPAVGVPAIRLDRWDGASQEWVMEQATVRQRDETTLDHVGVFEVTTNTVIGVYRFRLEGRDDTYNLIHAVSQNFTIRPTTVQRTLTGAPPAIVVKGELIEFSIEKRNGDQILDAEILFNGRSAKMQRPLMTSLGDRINVTFSVPYEAATGNYSVRVVGRDLYGNGLEVLSPQVEVAPADLLGKIIGNPTRVVERGEPASVIFGITNPDGGFYLSPETPEVAVHNGTGHVALASVSSEGLTFKASWTPDERTEETEYHFVISGTGVGGNTFPTMRSQPFRVAPGIVDRTPAGSPGLENKRMSTITFAVPFEPEDEYVTFSLGYYGPSYDVAPALFETRDPTTTTTLPHTIDVQSGRYIARFVTDHVTPLGAYRIFMEGTDRFGNQVVSKSGVFLLRPANILISPDATPPDGTFGEGKTYEHSFVARYHEGTIMTEQHGTPSVALLYDDGLRGRLPVAQRPELTYRDQRWHITWRGPEVMPDGAYTFTVGGADLASNPIGSMTTNDVVLRREADESLGIFLKEIPGPSPLLVLLALVGVAAWVARRKR